MFLCETGAGLSLPDNAKQPQQDEHLEKCLINIKCIIRVGPFISGKKNVAPNKTINCRIFFVRC